MRGLLVLGAGGHGRVVADAASGEFDRIAFLDDAGDAQPGHWPVLGPIEELAEHRQAFGAAAVSVGDNRRRLALLDRLAATEFRIVTILHPSAFVSQRARLGAGSVILAQAAVNIGAHIGRGCIVNTGATVDHDCVLGDGVHVSPGAHVAGGVTVGERSWIGIGAVVREGTAIGSDVIVGAGAAVVKDVEAGETVIGVPAGRA